MKKILLAVLSMGLLSTGLMANDIAGTWVTIDDETGLAKSHVNIWVHNGVAYGKVTKLLNRKPGEDPDPVCNECKGESHGKKVVGLTILWGLKADGDEWTGGHIMDPKNGKVYKCKIKLQDGGKTLKVRGFIGFSLIGRNQIWKKL
ncbi:MAG: DUF2147 domain-containing protein [Leptospiraceae bacterium]|nr:DUF2147 domain-containing protein [Leptospiraceae bacterium]